MRHENALYLVRHMMKRYASGGGPTTVWKHKGEHIPQWLIPRPARGAEAAAERNVGVGLQRIEHIDPNLCCSIQYHLDHSRLCKAMRNYSAWQRDSARLPIVFEWRGRYLIWNGNHRITCAILLGKSRMRAHVWRPKKKPRR